MPNSRSTCTVGSSIVPLILFCTIWTVGADTSIARAYCKLTTDSNQPGECVDSGIPLYWKCSNIEYAVCPRERDDPPFDVVLDAIEDSFQSWENVECEGEPIGFEFLLDDDPEDCDEHYRLKKDPDHDFSPDENLIVFIEDWDSFGYDPSAFALTSVWHNTKTGVIVGVDMEINETIGEFGVCGISPKRCRDVADIQNVVTHEVGHVLGLGHTDDETAVMFAESKLGDTEKRKLKDDDIEGICAIYLDEPLRYCSDSRKTRTACSVAQLGATERNASWVVLISCLIAFLSIHRRFV